MLKFENGRIQAEGTGAQLCMELSFLIKSVRENVADDTSGEFAEGVIMEAFENSKLSHEEITAKYIEGKKGAEHALIDLLIKRLFGGGF